MSTGGEVRGSVGTWFDELEPGEEFEGCRRRWASTERRQVGGAEEAEA